MIYLDAGATTLQKPPMVAYHMQSALRRMATPGRGAYAPAMRAADHCSATSSPLRKPLMSSR